LKGDVLTVLEKQGLWKGSETTALAKPVNPQEATDSITNLDEVKLPLTHDTHLQLRGYNRLMVSSMTQSISIPHMVYSDEIDLSALKPTQLKFLPYLIKSVSKALEKYPILNSSLQKDSIVLHTDHNFGIAIDTPLGLIVPVISLVIDLSIRQIGDELIRLKDLAYNGTLAQSDLEGATFTLSNIGAIGGGGTYMSPIITSQQVAIGAIGNIQRLPRFVSGDSDQVQEAQVCNISWAGDHRVVDGATMARFHSQVKDYLEDQFYTIASNS
jgi:2-oxoisovalerate dehydrogenase E2 component (dihydrolipoyl transacylase)